MYSFSQRLNQAIGFNLFGANAFANPTANVRNQGDIQLSTTLLQRMVIVDDGILTYNAYKSKDIELKNINLILSLLLCVDNTIRIIQWKGNVRNDRALLDCLEIMQQLGSHREVNVSKDLQYIIDTTSMYKPQPQNTNTSAAPH